MDDQELTEGEREMLRLLNVYMSAQFDAKKPRRCA